MNTLKRKRSSYISNNNNTSVTRVFTTPRRSTKRMIEVRMPIEDYNSYTDYKKYIKENNIEIPSGQSEYSQRLANLDIKYNRLKELHKNLIKLYNNLYKECKVNNKITKYGKRKNTIHTRKRKIGEELKGFNENEAFRNLGINDILIGNSNV